MTEITVALLKKKARLLDSIPDTIEDGYLTATGYGIYEYTDLEGHTTWWLTETGQPAREIAKESVPRYLEHIESCRLERGVMRQETLF